MKSISDLTIKEVNVELLHLIKTQPDFVYNKELFGTCYYNSGPAHNTKLCNGCIFGQSFQALGISQDSSELISRGDISSLWRKHHKETLPYFWDSIQKGQDKGALWGDLIYMFPIEVLKQTEKDYKLKYETI